MLKKLLKHEFHATGRIMLPLLGLMLLLSILAGFSIKALDSGVEGILLNLVLGLFVMGFFLSLFAVMVIAFVLMIQRFYKNLLGDEGYLMMTLPVSVDQHIFSKLIVSSVWYAAVAIGCVIAVFIMLAFNIDNAEFQSFFSGFEGITDYVSVINIIGFCLEFLVMFFIGCSSSCLLVYASLAFGHSFSNHKMLLSVVAFFGFSFIMNIVQVILTWVVGVTGLADNIIFYVDTAETYQYAGIAHSGMLIMIVIGLVFAAIYYFITTLLLKKKLNLA